METRRAITDLPLSAGGAERLGEVGCFRHKDDRPPRTADDLAVFKSRMTE